MTISSLSSLEYLSGPFNNKQGKRVITVIDLDDDVIREIPWNCNRAAKLFMVEPLVQKMVRSLPGEQIKQEAKEPLTHYLTDLIIDATASNYDLKIGTLEVLSHAFLHGFYEAYYE